MKPLSLALLLFALSVFSALSQSNGSATADTSLAGIVARQSLQLNGMVAEKADEKLRTKLSNVWTMESLSMIGADVFASYIPDTQENLEEFAGGEENVKYYMLSGAIVYTIPISMISMSRYLPYGGARWTNIGAAAVGGLDQSADYRRRTDHLHERTLTKFMTPRASSALTDFAGANVVHSRFH